MQAVNQKPEVLAIIPARGGSKGIPRKNIRDLCGKPLIAYSIEAALKSKLIDRVVVSTEDEEIAEISKSFKAEVPFLRPPQMAGDHSSISEATNYTLSRLNSEGYNPDIAVSLYPTHPFRTPALIDNLLEKIIEGHSPVNAGKRIVHTATTMFYQNSGKRLYPLLDGNIFKGTTIAGKSFYRSYGLFTGASCHPHMSNAKPYIHIIDNPVSLIDIDTFADLYLAEEIIKKGLFDFDVL
jgi:CMP-N-acetylneuraminic acid synthetase